jgi:hypothetical protein
MLTRRGPVSEVYTMTVEINHASMRATRTLCAATNESLPLCALSFISTACKPYCLFQQRVVEYLVITVAFIKALVRSVAEWTSLR